MSVIGFKDILVCSLVSDVQNVSWTKPMWVAQISSLLLALSEGWWDQCVDSECICLAWFMTPGLPFWQPSSAISLHLSFSLFILTAGLSERAWTQSTNISDAACDRGVSQHPPIPPCSACLISLCVCVCVFKCVSLTICFSLPLVLLLAFHFKRNWFSFIAFFVCDPFDDVCVFAQFCVSTRFYTLEDTDSWNLCCVCIRVCCACLSTPPCSSS